MVASDVCDVLMKRSGLLVSQGTPFSRLGGCGLRD